MTRIPMKMFAFAALAIATPAAAQWGGSAVDTQSLRAEIDAGVSRGDISGQEAYSLRSQLSGLINLERQYARDGVTVNERYDLQQRAQGLRNEIAEAQGYASGYGRYDNRGYDSRDRSYGTYGNAYDRGYGSTYNNGTYGNAYGNRGYGAYNGGAYGNGGYGAYNNNTYNNGAYANRGYGSGQYRQDDRYDDRYADRRDDDRDDAYDRDDRDDDGYALRVGERVSGGLYAVPDAYRYRFRDSGSVYYRYGNGNVYQIDARTGVVLRIYPIGR